MTPLNAAEITERLRALPGWQLQDGQLVRTVRFRDFREAMAFVKKLAEAAEERQHHPNIDIRYNKVRLALVTHDAGGITDKDTELAGFINQIAPA